MPLLSHRAISCAESCLQGATAAAFVCLVMRPISGSVAVAAGAMSFTGINRATPFGGVTVAVIDSGLPQDGGRTSECRHRRGVEERSTRRLLDSPSSVDMIRS